MDAGAVPVALAALLRGEQRAPEPEAEQDGGRPALPVEQLDEFPRLLHADQRGADVLWGADVVQGPR